MSTVTHPFSNYYWTSERKTRAAQEIVTGHMTLNQFCVVYHLEELEVETWIVDFLNSRIGRLGLVPRETIKSYAEKVASLEKTIAEQQKQIDLLIHGEEKNRVVPKRKDDASSGRDRVPALWRA